MFCQKVQFFTNAGAETVNNTKLPTKILKTKNSAQSLFRLLTLKTTARENKIFLEHKPLCHSLELSSASYKFSRS